MVFYASVAEIPLPTDIQLLIADHYARMCMNDVIRHVEFHHDCVDLVYTIVSHQIMDDDVPDISWGRFMYAVTQQHAITSACREILKGKHQDTERILREVAGLWGRRYIMDADDFLLAFASRDASMRVHERLLRLLATPNEIDCLISLFSKSN